MVKVGELYGELRLNKRPFDQGLDQAEGKARGWSSRVGGILKGSAGFLAKWGVIGGAAVAGFGVVSANFASDLNETLSKVNVVFGKAGKEVIAWAEDSATAMGMSKNAALGAAGTYGNLFRAMGITTSKSQDMSTGLVELAADLASFNNMDPTEVLDKLRAGLSGETEPLRTLGVNLNQARIEAKALEMGLWDGVGTIDAAAKAQATYALILKDTTLAQGDFKRTSGGMANQQRMLAATFEDTMAQIGTAFMPIIIELLPMFREALVSVADWVTANMPTIQAVIGTAMEFVGAAISFIFNEVVPRLVEAFTWFVNDVLPLFTGAVDNVSTNVLPAFAGVIQWIVDNVWPMIVTAFQVMTEVILPVLQKAFAAVVGWVKDNWPAISSIVKQVAGAVKTAFEVIMTVIRVAWPIIEAVGKVLFPIIGAAATVLLGAIDIAFKAIGGIWEGAATIAKSIVKAIKTAWDGLTGFFKGLWDGIGNAIKAGINFVIGLINGMIDLINGIQIHIPGIETPFGTVAKFDWNGLQLGKIPYLARGARNFGGGWAMVGEHGPELAYLPQGANVYSAQESRQMIGGRVEVVLRDPDHALPPGVSERGVARLLEDALNTGPFVRQLRHDAVRS